MSRRDRVEAPRGVRSRDRGGFSTKRTHDCLIVALLALAALAGPAAAQQGAGSEAQQRAMGAISHPPPAPGGVPEKSEAVMKVTTRVLCMCGGCVNQTLHECTCGTAAQERDAVASKIAGGKTPEEVIQAYVDEFGAQILSTPEKKGFNLLGWLVPFIVAILLLAALTFILRRWVRLQPIEPLLPASASPPPADPVERRYRERLEQELKDFEA